MLAALRLLEEQRRAAGLDRAVDDLGHLEVRIDLGGDADELALALEERDPRRAGRAGGATAASLASVARARRLRRCGGGRPSA